MVIVFDNERKKYIPTQRLQEEIKYGTGCNIGGAVYLPSSQYSYNGSAINFKGIPILRDYSPLSMITNAIETGKLIKDIAQTNNTPEEIAKVLSNRGNGSGSDSDLAKLLNAKLPPKNGKGFLLLSKNK